VANGVGRASHHDDAFAIDPKCTGQIPPSLIGRQLARDEATDLLTMLKIPSRESPIIATGALVD
jgi:hypothetical protein